MAGAVRRLFGAPGSSAVVLVAAVTGVQVVAATAFVAGGVAGWTIPLLALTYVPPGLVAATAIHRRTGVLSSASRQVAAVAIVGGSVQTAVLVPTTGTDPAVTMGLGTLAWVGIALLQQAVLPAGALDRGALGVAAIVLAVACVTAGAAAVVDPLPRGSGAGPAMSGPDATTGAGGSASPTPTATATPTATPTPTVVVVENPWDRRRVTVRTADGVPRALREETRAAVSYWNGAGQQYATYPVRLVYTNGSEADIVVRAVDQPSCGAGADEVVGCAPKLFVDSSPPPIPSR